MAAAAFAGFPKDLFSFLAQLGLHNEREWISTTDLKLAQLTSPKAVEEVAATFARAKPLLQYLCACVDVES
jgi:uncharacterized protein (DUF2461 family)